MASELYLHGISKCGTHALTKAVELLGVPIVKGHGSISRGTYAVATIAPGSVFIYRHPRNAIVSRVRMTKADVVTQGFLIAAMADIHEEWMGYLPFLSDPEVLAIRLDDLIGDGGVTMRRIADHIGQPYLEDAYENLPGMTFSWNAIPSRWQAHWSEPVDVAWVEARGPEVETAFGYG